MDKNIIALGNAVLLVGAIIWLAIRRRSNKQLDQIQETMDKIDRQSDRIINTLYVDMEDRTSDIIEAINNSHREETKIEAE